MINRDKIVEVNYYPNFIEDNSISYRKPIYINIFGFKIYLQYGGYYYYSHSINLPDSHIFTGGQAYEKPHIIIRLVDGSKKFYHYDTKAECIKEYENYKVYLK